MDNEKISSIDIHSKCPCLSNEFPLAQLKHKFFLENHIIISLNIKTFCFLKAHAFGHKI